MREADDLREQIAEEATVARVEALVADGGLREAVARWLAEYDGSAPSRWDHLVPDASKQVWRTYADELLSGPLDAVLRERDRLRAALAEVRDWDAAAAQRHGGIGVRDFARRSLDDGTTT